jgi:hypothetical protein
MSIHGVVDSVLSHNFLEMLRALRVVDTEVSLFEDEIEYCIPSYLALVQNELWQ